VDHEDGPLVPEKILVAVKQYWVGNSTSAQWMMNGNWWNLLSSLAGNASLYKTWHVWICLSMGFWFLGEYCGASEGGFYTI
jgi:hypothetical protein